MFISFASQRQDIVPRKLFDDPDESMQGGDRSDADTRIREILRRCQIDQNDIIQMKETEPSEWPDHAKLAYAFVILELDFIEEQERMLELQNLVLLKYLRERQAEEESSTTDGSESESKTSYMDHEDFRKVHGEDSDSNAEIPKEIYICQETTQPREDLSP